MKIDSSMINAGFSSVALNNRENSAAVRPEAVKLPSDSIDISVPDSGSPVKKKQKSQPQQPTRVSEPVAEKNNLSETQPKTRSVAVQSPPSTLAVLEDGMVSGGNASKTSKVGDQYLLNDGFDSSRDITAITTREGSPSEPYSFKVTMKELKEGAQNGHLDLYLLLNLGKEGGKLALPDNIPGSTASPWNMALCGYDDKNFSILDENGQMDKNFLQNIKYDTKSSSVEFSLDKEALRQKGWTDGAPLQIQPFTAKDFVKQVTDSLDDPGNKIWDNGKLSTFIDTLKDTSMPSMPDPSGGRPVEKWRNDIIYFVMTDRFSDGDKTNNMNVDLTNNKKYHGGDLQGIINNLDYIKDIGASSVWITPVMKNQTEFFDSEGYHGYWPIDFFDTDAHVGSMEKFQELVDTAHEKDLKIILDIPLNHMAWEHPFYKDPEKKDWFHHIGDIKDFDDPYQAENGSLFGLPDLAQENPEVYKYLLDVSKFWIDKGIDGFRLDAVKNVPADFWNKFSSEVHDYAGKDFFLVGECFDGEPSKLNKYQKGDMDSLFDYPLHFTMVETFAKDGSMRNIANRLAECDAKYDHPEMMSVFLDNHDTPRFLSVADGNRDKMKLALSFAMTINRIPTIYYGTEVGMDGGCDIMGEIENRNDMEWNKDPDMLNYFKTLSSVRNNNIAMREGTQLEMWQDDKILAFSRNHPEQEAVVILNNAYDSQYREVPLRAESQIKDGTVMKDMMTGQTVTVKNGKICASVDGKRAGVFIPVK